MRFSGSTTRRRVDRRSVRLAGRSLASVSGRNRRPKLAKTWSVRTTARRASGSPRWSGVGLTDCSTRSPHSLADLEVRHIFRFGVPISTKAHSRKTPVSEIRFLNQTIAGKFHTRIVTPAVRASCDTPRCRPQFSMLVISMPIGCCCEQRRKPCLLGFHVCESD